MPLIQRNSGDGNDDRSILVDNEETPITLDNDFGGIEDAGGYVGDLNNANFIPAALPEHSYDDLENIDLPKTRVLLSNAPADSHNFTYFVFYLLGTATMTPWNFFVTAEDYWMFKFRNTTTANVTEIIPELTPMQRSFTCDLTLTASMSGTICLILNAVYGHYVSLKLKMIGTMSVILLLFVITTSFVEVNSDHWQEQFFLITLFTVLILNSCSAVMSGGAFGIAGLFPSEYMSALVSGQALGGIFTALTFILVLTFGAPPNVTAFIFFIIGSVLILLCIICYVAMTRQQFFKYYLGGGDKYEFISETPLHSRTVDTGVSLEPNIRIVFGKIYVETVTMCLLFATTVSVYPAVTVLMQSEHYGSGRTWDDVYYMPVVNYLFFNSGDYFGRVLAGIFERPRDNPHTVLLLTVMRLLYIPFFLCSNTNIHVFLPTLVHSDLAFIWMMITFSLSNGYLTNILLMMVPRAVLQHEKETASAIMAASLSCGLALGSMLSMIFVQML